MVIYQDYSLGYKHLRDFVVILEGSLLDLKTLYGHLEGLLWDFCLLVGNS